MLNWFFIILINLIYVREHAVAIHLIRPFRNISEGKTALGAYHLAKIIPPAKYRVIIWKKIYSDRRILLRTGANTDFNCSTVFPAESHQYSKESLRINAQDLAKCFANFYTVQTDEKGRFLMLINGKLPHEYLSMDRTYQLSIIPLDFENSEPISNNYSMSPRVAIQEFHELDIGDTVDTLCQFFDQRCLISYSNSLNTRWENVTELLNKWLSRTGIYNEFSKKENFFLLANFRDLLDKAKHYEMSNTKIPIWEASFLGQFWNAFARTRKSGMLWKRLRLVNQRMVGLINEFCEISADFLTWNRLVAAEISKSNEPEKFCTFWPSVKEKASKLIQDEIAMDTFIKWINTSELLRNEEEQIILYWIEVFAKRLSSYSFRWPELDKTLFIQIGQLFANARKEHFLTLDKIERIKTIRNNLDMICQKIDRVNRTSLFQVPTTWSNELCANDKFQHAITHIITNRGEKRNLSDILGSNSTKCVNCMNEERKVAFDPCGHYCVCQECSANTSKCPVCEVKIRDKVTIFDV